MERRYIGNQRRIMTYLISNERKPGAVIEFVAVFYLRLRLRSFEIGHG